MNNIKVEKSDYGLKAQKTLAWGNALRNGNYPNHDFDKINKINKISNPLCSLCILSVPCGKRFKPQSSQRFYTKFTNNNHIIHSSDKQVNKL